MIEKVNMSPVIIENIIVTNGPVSLIALIDHKLIFVLGRFTDLGTINSFIQ